MQFLHKEDEKKELTYEDVFLIPQYSEIKSRMDVDITPSDRTGATIPVTVSNMTSAAGKRMAETVTRRGGIVTLTQDTPLERLEHIIKYIKSRHQVFETPVVLTGSESIQTALNLINKRAHGAIVIVDDKNKPIGVFTEADAEGKDRFAMLKDVMTTDIISADESVTPREAFKKLESTRISILPIINNSGELLGIMTKKGAVRSEIYKPALNKDGDFVTSVAVRTTGDVIGRVEALLNMGVDIIALDTAHGNTKRMLDVVKSVRDAIPKNTIIHVSQAVTAKGTENLINAGADLINVGIGAGGSCTTRVMTGTGRPQFSAVLECARQAREMGKHVWADSGIVEPRNLVMAMAAGAVNTMSGTIFAGTYESPGDIQIDKNGRPYKVSIGMASTLAVKTKFENIDPFDLAKKQYFREGTHKGKIYLKEGLSGVEDIIDYLIAGLRSALSYSGANNLDEFYDKATVGVQTQAAANKAKAIEKW